MTFERCLSVKVGRNQLCLCGSGKKYKRCCLDKEQVVERDRRRKPSITGEGLLLIDESKKPSVSREDFQLMEEIGIPFEEAEQFYVKDILCCFREKGEGKSQSTYYKYRLGLQTIGYFLSQKILTSWSDINEKDWEKWLSFNYLAFNMDATVSQVKGFMTVLKNFIIKIDETYGTAHADMVQKLVKEIEPSILAAVKTLDAYASYQVRRQEPEFDMDRLFEMLQAGPMATESSAEGMFQVKDRDEKGVNLLLLGSDDLTYTVEMNQDDRENMEAGAVMAGTLTKENQWTFSSIIRIFPPQAAPYISTILP